MRYDIRLSISHDYEGRAGSSRHLLRLIPRDLPGRQQVLSSRVIVEPAPVERSAHRDFFGNAGLMAVHDGAHSQLTVTARADVRVDGLADALDMSPSIDGLARQLAAEKTLSPGSPLHFLGASPRIPEVSEIAAYAREVTGAARTARAAMAALGNALHDDMTFDADSTSVDTSAADAFAQRRGVCQDFTHIMITGLRSLGIPAGYVSGFLRTEPPEGQPRLDGADAMHAWVRAWCGQDVGWTEFDPTNAMPASADHIVVAYGRDYGDVAPVTGVLKASGGQVTSQSVDVLPVPDTD